jgi:hypothetical protein
VIHQEEEFAVSLKPKLKSVSVSGIFPDNHSFLLFSEHNLKTKGHFDGCCIQVAVLSWEFLEMSKTNLKG